MSQDRPKPTKRKKKEYWGPIEEAAIVRYLELPPGDPEADQLFADKIFFPLRKLVESIMFTYHLSIQEISVDEQIYDCMSFVVSKMRKFDPAKGCKSFSYLGTVAKNDMIVKKNKHQRRKVVTVPLSEIEGFEYLQELHVEHEFESELNSNEFLLKIISQDLKDVLHSDITLHPNIYKVGEAVVNLLDNYQYINLQNKRQFYFIVKEFTGLQTKEVTAAMLTIKRIFNETCKVEK